MVVIIIITNELFIRHFKIILGMVMSFILSKLCLVFLGAGLENHWIIE